MMELTADLQLAPAMTVDIDTELLRFAARAAGIMSAGLAYENDRQLAGLNVQQPDGSMYIWNPIADGGDSFWLAATLKISIQYYEGYVQARWGSGEFVNVGIMPSRDVHAASKRAVTLAAATIGRMMR